MVARFVTAKATELTLGIHVPLHVGDSYSETYLRHHMIPGLATRGHDVKTQKL